MAWLKREWWWHDIRRRPTLLVLPVLVVIAVAIAADLMVFFGAELYVKSAQSDARTLSLSICNQFSAQFDLALGPLFAIEKLLRINPNYTDMRPFLIRFITDLLPHYPTALIQVDPFMIGGIELPAGVADANHNVSGLVRVPQRNLLPLAHWPLDTITGPRQFNYPSWGVSVKHLIYVDRHWDLLSFGMGYDGRNDPGREFNSCALCHSVNPGMQLWGASSSNIDLQHLRNGTDPHFSQLNGRYSYKLWQTGHFSYLFNDSLARVDIASVGSPVLSDPITVAFDVIAGNTWYLDLEPHDTWWPSWALPLLICLPFVSLLLGLLVLSRLIAADRHLRLLQALVPADTANYATLYGDLDASSALRNSIDDDSPAGTPRSKPLMPLSESTTGDGGGGGVDRSTAPPSTYLATGTPAERILTLLGQLLEGCVPPTSDILAIRQAFKESADLFTAPAALGTMMARKLSGDVTAALLTIVNQGMPGAYLSKAGSTVAQELRDLNGQPVVDGVNVQGLVSRSIAGNHVATRAFTETIRGLLHSACNDWYYDMAPLREATNDHALSTLATYILTVDTSLALKLRLDVGRLAAFMEAVEGKYNANPYHNRTHAADVVQMYHVITKRCMLRRGYLNGPLARLACIFAAAVHDIDHKGVNNDFLVNSGDPLALMHNDKSPMEAHHCHVAFTMLRRPECNFLRNLPPAEVKVFRALAIDLVLATDMKQHFAVVAQFTSRFRLANAAALPVAGALGRTVSHDTSAVAASFDKLRTVRLSDSGGESFSTATVGPVPEDGERLIALQAALKISDIGHICRPIAVASRSLEALEEEFFRQGDQERSLGLPISPLFDRSKEGVSKAQKGFLEFIAIPLVHNFVHVFPECKPLLSELKRNYQLWAAPNPPLHQVLSIKR